MSYRDSAARAASLEPGASASRAPIAAHRASLSDGAWLASGQLTGALVTVVGTRAVTQFVDPLAFGVANLLQNLVALLRGVLVTPLLNAGFWFVADAQRDGQLPMLSRTLRTDLLRLLAGAVPLLLMLMLWSAASVPGWLRLVPLMVALLLADAWRNLELTLVAARRDQRRYAIATLAENIVRPVLIVLLASQLGSSSGSVLLGVLAGLLAALAALRLSHGTAASASERVTDSPRYLGALRRYALELAPYGLMSWVLGVSDRYIIAWLAPDVAAVGIYAAGYGLVSQPFTLLNGVLAGVFRPPWFAASAANDDPAAALCRRQWLGFAALGAIAGWLLTFWLAAPVTRLLLGPRYGAAAELLPWIALGYACFLLQQVIENQLLAHKRSRAVLLSGLVAALLAVGATIPLVMHFGMPGAAYACPVYFGGQLLVCLWLARRHGNSP